MIETASKPKIILGNKITDSRGILRFNNEFDLKEVRRFYEIENINSSFKRGWKGHHIEQRWFLATKGKIEVKILKMKDISLGLSEKKCQTFILDSETMDVLYVPSGFATCIKQLSVGGKLLAMSDYLIGVNDDEQSWDVDNLWKVL